MLFTVRYQTLSQKDNFEKFIVPKSTKLATSTIVGANGESDTRERAYIVSGDQVEARAIFGKLVSDQAINAEEISNAALCYGGRIVNDNKMFEYRVIERWNNQSGLTVIEDPEPIAKPKVAQEEPEEIVAEL